jgi:hypothetical protein
MRPTTYPDGTLAQPRLPSLRWPIIGGLLALLIGGAIATGIYLLTDDDAVVSADPSVVVVGPPSKGVMAKDEATVAAAVVPAPGIVVNPSTGFAYGTSQYRVPGGPSGTVGEGTTAKDEAATAAAVSSGVHVGSGPHQHGE